MFFGEVYGVFFGDVVFVLIMEIIGLVYEFCINYEF